MLPAFFSNGEIFCGEMVYRTFNFSDEVPVILALILSIAGVFSL